MAGAHVGGGYFPSCQITWIATRERILKMPDLPKRLRVSWIFKYGVVCVYVSWLKRNFGRDFDVYFWKFIVVNYQNHFLMVSNKIARVSL